MKHKKSNKTIKSKFEDIFFFRYRLHTTGQYEYILRCLVWWGVIIITSRNSLFKSRGGKGSLAFHTGYELVINIFFFT